MEEDILKLKFCSLIAQGRIEGAKGAAWPQFNSSKMGVQHPALWEGWNQVN